MSHQKHKPLEDQKMKPRIKMGLIAGGIGLVLNIFVSTLFGICGPAISLIAGGAAGLLAVQQEKPSNKSEGASVGGMAGLIAGGLTLIGQIIGGLGALFLIQSTPLSSAFGFTPDDASTLIYYAAGIGTAFCFGLVGALLAAGAGAGAGYVATPEQPASPIDPTQG
jgi:hypothetical protein